MFSFKGLVDSFRTGLNRYIPIMENSQVRQPEKQLHEGFRATAGKGGLTYVDKNGKAAFVDRGRSVEVGHPPSDANISAALSHSLKGREAVKVRGSDAFKAKTALAAWRSGAQDKVSGIKPEVLLAAHHKYLTEEIQKQKERQGRAEQARMDKIDQSERERKVSQEKARQAKGRAQGKELIKKAPTVPELAQQRALRQQQGARVAMQAQERAQAQANAAAMNSPQAKPKPEVQQQQAKPMPQPAAAKPEQAKPVQAPVLNSGKTYAPVPWDVRAKSPEAVQQAEKETQLQARYDQQQKAAQAQKQSEPGWQDREMAEQRQFNAAQQEKYRENSIQSGPAQARQKIVMDSRHEAGSRPIGDHFQFRQSDMAHIDAAGRVLRQHDVHGNYLGGWVAQDDETKVLAKNPDYRLWVERAGGRFENQKPVRIEQLEVERAQFFKRQESQQKAEQAKQPAQKAELVKAPAAVQKQQAAKPVSAPAPQAAKAPAAVPQRAGAQQATHCQKSAARVEVRQAKAPTQAPSRGPSR